MTRKPLKSPVGPALRKSSQHANMRRKNESVLLALIRRHGGLPSADLARRSGFAPQTVSVLLKGLEEQGVVVRGAALRGRRGQPAVPMLINPEGGYSVGVELGWRHIDTVLVNLAGEVLATDHLEFDYARAPEAVRLITSSIGKVAGELPEAARPRLTGAAIAKPTDMYRHIQLLGASDAEIVALETTDLVAEVQKQFDFPVFAGNDGTLACRAECLYGRGTESSDILHVFVSTFVGSGVHVDGRTVEGNGGQGANIGSSMVPAAGGEVHALHLVGSVRALETRIEAAGKSVPRTAPVNWDWAAIAPETEAWLDAASSGYALVIANSSAVIGFSAAIVDGILPDKVMDDLVTRISEKISGLPIMTFKAPLILRGHVGPHAPAIGAADLPLHAAVFAPEVFEGLPPNPARRQS